MKGLTYLYAKKREKMPAIEPATTGISDTNNEHKSIDNPLPDVNVAIADSEFTETYQPIKNHLDLDAAWDGCFFETYGEEMAFVLAIYAATPKRVWTILECDLSDYYPTGEEPQDGAWIENQVVTTGLHFVNRCGYLITAVDAPEGMQIDVYDSEILDVIQAHQRIN